MDKLKMQSPNLVDANIVKIAEMFPNCIAEAKDENGILRRVVDFDLLRQELSATLVEGPQERYTLSWPGKNEAILTANAPIAKTLRPCEEESIDFENTKNIYIEGDNLDVLKLLQETYLNTVAVLYIDQPYNTGNDFIYEDDFAEDTESFLIRSNQKDETGNRLVANTDSNGRFHSDWLSMMYPRLKQARNLLRADGVIFISIDDNEVMNLRRLCDEVFGEGNYCGQVTVLCNPKGRSQDKYLATCHEYLLIYSKTPLPKGALSVPKSIDEIASDYPLKDKRGIYRELELRNTHREFGKHNRKNLYYPFYVGPNGKVDLVPEADAVSVTPDWDDGFEGCWTWGKEKSQSQIQDLVAKKVKNNWKIYRKGYASDPEDDEVPRKQLKSIWLDKKYHTEKGQSVFNDLFGVKEKIFQAPKSIDVLVDCIAMCQNKEGIILDIFSGSATTAHAVMQLNAEDSGNRKFIMVQLPEPCDEKSEAYKAGYKTIAEIGKERIRRAGKKIKDERVVKQPSLLDAPLAANTLDIGFRVFKVDTSNMKDVYYTPDELKQNNLELFKDHIKSDRRPEDLLFQVFLDWGLDLALPIAKETIDGKKVFVVDTDALIACFDSGITEELVKKLAKYKPVRVVFRDDAFGSDSFKINVEQIFKLLSPKTEVKSI